jgi:cyanophycinase
MAKKPSHRANGNGAGARTVPPPPLAATPRSPRGTLMVIGGGEKRNDRREILEVLAKRAGAGRLIVATLASEEPRKQWEEYRKVFAELGVRRVEQLDVRSRQELIDDPREDFMKGAAVLFFAGGDQLKITSRFGGTPLCDRIREWYEAGAMIAGTSSGASVMSETMMVSGAGDESHGRTESLRMSPGLGLIPGVIIDQHFAERGRIGRLLGAVAQNPRLLGLGIDEDTAVIFDDTREFSVIGSGAVYVIDGRNLTYTSTAEDKEGTASVHGLTLHVLSAGDTFDLRSREPRAQPAKRTAAGNGRAAASR